MTKLRWSLLGLLLLIPLASVFGQGAPEPIQDALADLSQRVGQELTLNDFFWTWEQIGFEDTSLGCPQSGQSYEQTPTVGYKFLFTYAGNIYDYRVSADRSILILCTITAVEDQGIATPSPITGDEEAPYTNPLCPDPPEGITYMHTRLAPEIQARVVPGLPNRTRAEPDTNAEITGEIPGGGIFTVLSGPGCDEEGYLWWQVDYDGFVGLTAEGRNSEYLVEPLPGLALPAERDAITAENAAQVSEVSRLQGNLGSRLAFTQTDAATWLVALGDTGSEGVWIYDLAALDQPPRIPQSSRRLTDVAFATSGEAELALLGSSNGGVRLWDIAPGTNLVERAFLLGHDTAVSAVAFNPDGTTIASSGGKAFLREAQDDNLYAIVLWDVRSVSQTAGLRGHTGSVTALAFGPPGVLASGSQDGTLRLWNLETGTADTVVEAPASINDLTYHSNYSSIALALSNGTIALVNASGGAIYGTLSAHRAAVTSVDDNGEGLLVSGGEDGAAYLWNIGDEAAQPTLLSGHTDAVIDVAFSPDGSLIATLGLDHTIRLWSINRAAVG